MMANYIRKHCNLSITKSCQFLNLSRADYYRENQRNSVNDEIASVLKTLASRHKRWGCDKMIAYLKNEGKLWNHKRIRRIYNKLELNIRVKPKRHFAKISPERLFQPIYKNVCWSIDFMSDALIGGIKFRTLNVIDDYHRKAIGIAIAFSMPAKYVTDQLDRWCQCYGYPEMIRTDNGPEFVSIHFQNWAKQRKIELRHIQPGKPAQNGFVERFNRTYRGDVLDANQFFSLQEVISITEEWILEYNTIRPHQALNNLPPEIFAMNREKYIQNNFTKQFG
jgi:putative transposase